MPHDSARRARSETMIRYLVTHYCGRRWTAKYMIDDWSGAVKAQRADIHRSKCSRRDCTGKHYATIRERIHNPNLHLY